jgi:hypothetical protein
MATHRISVLFPSTVLPDTTANEQRVFVFSGSLGASVGQIGGNIGKRVPPSGQHHFDLNHPRVPGAISVSSYSPQKYDSADLAGQPSLVSQLADAIEGGYVEIKDEDAQLAGQTGAAATMAAAAGGQITVTGLTGMTAASVGNLLIISGAATGANNGTFIITTYNSATSVDIAAGAAPGSDANNGSLTWAENGVVQDRAALTALL